MSTIGIIGAGAIGSAFAKALSRQGIPLVIANSRGPETLAELVAELGPTAVPLPVKKRRPRTSCWSR